MKIVVNSGPLISLARIGHLDLLPRLFGEILVPGAVFAEVTRDLSLPGAAAVQGAEWLTVCDVADRSTVDRLSFWLDAGESEVVALAQELGVTAPLTSAGRATCRQHSEWHRLERSEFCLLQSVRG